MSRKWTDIFLKEAVQEGLQEAVRRYNFKSLPVREGPNQLTVSCERHGPGKGARAAFKLDVRGVPEAFAERSLRKCSHGLRAPTCAPTRARTQSHGSDARTSLTKSARTRHCLFLPFVCLLFTPVVHACCLQKECLGRSGLGGDWSRPEAKDLRESVLLQWQCLHNEATQKHTKVCTKWHGCLKKAERLERVLEILDAIVAKKADPLPQLAGKSVGYSQKPLADVDRGRDLMWTGVAKEVEALPNLEPPHCSHMAAFVVRPLHHAWTKSVGVLSPHLPSTGFT